MEQRRRGGGGGEEDALLPRSACLFALSASLLLAPCLSAPVFCCLLLLLAFPCVPRSLLCLFVCVVLLMCVLFCACLRFVCGLVCLLVCALLLCCAVLSLFAAAFFALAACSAWGFLGKVSRPLVWPAPTRSACCTPLLRCSKPRRHTPDFSFSLARSYRFKQRRVARAPAEAKEEEGGKKKKRRRRGSRKPRVDEEEREEEDSGSERLRINIKWKATWEPIHAPRDLNILVSSW